MLHRNHRGKWRSAPHVAALLVFGLMLQGCGSVSDVTGSVTSMGGLLASAPQAGAQSVQIFTASTRPASGGDTPSGDVHFALETISVPPDHRAGAIEQSRFLSASPDSDFMLAGERPLEDDAFAREVAIHLSGRVGTDRDILVFVHGFNTSLDQARFRLAQIVTDSHFGGVAVLFTWPSQASLLAYGSDRESATASRDALEHMLFTLSQTPGLGQIHVLAHSMGGWIAMEALRQNAIAGHADLGGHLGTIMLAAPDIDLNVFKAQMARLNEPGHVSILVSSGDRALSLSSRLAGDRPRLGAMDPSNPRDQDALHRLGVKVYDLSSISDGLFDHGAYADAPDVLRRIGVQLSTPRANESQLVATGGAVFPKAADSPLTPVAVSASVLPAPQAAIRPPAALPASQ